MLSITSPESSWPGERDASRRDVEVANEIPEPGLLSDFKRALLASPDALGIDRLMHMELGGRVNVRLPSKRRSCVDHDRPRNKSDSHTLLRFYRIFQSSPVRLIWPT